MMVGKNIKKREYTNLSIKKATKDRLAKYGTKNETWDTLLNNVLNELEGLRMLSRAVDEEADAECKQKIMSRMNILKAMLDLAKTATQVNKE